MWRVSTEGGSEAVAAALTAKLFIAATVLVAAITAGTERPTASRH